MKNKENKTNSQKPHKNPSKIGSDSSKKSNQDSKSTKKAIITLIIGDQLEQIEINEFSNLKEIALSVVNKHNLAMEAIDYLEENIKNQILKASENNIKQENTKKHDKIETSLKKNSYLSEKSTILSDSTKEKSIKDQNSFIRNNRKIMKNDHFHENLYQKGIDFLKKKEERNEYFRQKQTEKQLKEATFRPKIYSIHTESNENIKNHSISQIRGRDISEELYKNGIKSRENREKSCEIFRNQDISTKCSFKPELSPETKRIIESKGLSNEKVEKRLYKLEEVKGKEQWRDEKMKEMYSFKPNLELSRRKFLRKIEKSPKHEKSQEKKDEKFDYIPKITKDLYYFKAKKREKIEMERFRRKLLFIEETDKSFRKKSNSQEKLMNGKNSRSLSKNSTNNSKIIQKNKEKINVFFKKNAKIVFSLLDSDRDLRISADKIDLSQIHPFLLEIIQEILFEMEAKQISLNFEEFLNSLKKFQLEQKLKQYFNNNDEKIDCFHNPQFSFGDYSENMRFLSVEKQEIEKIKESEENEKNHDFFTKHYKTLIKNSFEN